jgi:hypothetical protein
MSHTTTVARCSGSTIMITDLPCPSQATNGAVLQGLSGENCLSPRCVIFPLYMSLLEIDCEDFSDR